MEKEGIAMQTNPYGISPQELARQLAEHFSPSHLDEATARYPFFGFSEFVVLRMKLKDGVDRETVQQAFEEAGENSSRAPIDQFFKIQGHGFYSKYRSPQEMQKAFGSEFDYTLRIELSDIFFKPAPAFAYHPLAADTKHDVIFKLWENRDDEALIVLADDPGASLLDYVSYPSFRNDWSYVTHCFEKHSAEFQLG